MAPDAQYEWATPESKLPLEFVRHVKSIAGLRPRRVIAHILEHGYVTTEELKSVYGYEHPPRAARDVREAGIPLVTKRVSGATGRMVGAYIFGDPAQVRRDRVDGRQVLSRHFKEQVFAAYGYRCGICSAKYEFRYLQCDHRIPYEISGEPDGERIVADYMPLCGTDQRAKSWSCEHCPNFTAGDPEVCDGCYWANPREYSHVATQQERRVDITWQGSEVAAYDDLRERANASSTTVADLLKRLGKTDLS
jgi:hypothetical protein